MLRSRTRLLRCKIERIEGDEAFISAEQDDLTPANGLTLLSELTTDMLDPRFSLIEVEVLKETQIKALIQWPAQCSCLELCPGDEFWVNKKSLVKD
jgi:hypothetical protein